MQPGPEVLARALAIMQMLEARRRTARTDGENEASNWLMSVEPEDGIDEEALRLLEQMLAYDVTLGPARPASDGGPWVSRAVFTYARDKGEGVLDSTLEKKVGEMRELAATDGGGGSSLLDVEELELLRVQVTDLQTRNTELVYELRDVDRQRMVREFHAVVVEKPDPERPVVPHVDVVRLRLRLITEEYCELMAAAFAEERIEIVIGDIGVDGVERILMRLIDEVTPHVDLVSFADATVDLDYVVEGTRLAFGLDSRGLWRVVHAANMKKRGGPRRLSDGKRLKPPDWQPPDIEGEIARQILVGRSHERGPR